MWIDKWSLELSCPTAWAGLLSAVLCPNLHVVWSKLQASIFYAYILDTLNLLILGDYFDNCIHLIL